MLKNSVLLLICSVALVLSSCSTEHEDTDMLRHRVSEMEMEIQELQSDKDDLENNIREMEDKLLEIEDELGNLKFRMIDIEANQF